MIKDNTQTEKRIMWFYRQGTRHEKRFQVALVHSFTLERLCLGRLIRVEFITERKSMQRTLKERGFTCAETRHSFVLLLVSSYLPEPSLLLTENNEYRLNCKFWERRAWNNGLVRNCAGTRLHCTKCLYIYSQKKETVIRLLRTPSFSARYTYLMKPQQNRNYSHKQEWLLRECERRMRTVTEEQMLMWGNGCVEEWGKG